MSDNPKPSGMYCSISGIIPDVPVVSTKSGHIFEKRLILQALEASGGVCPETGQALSASDLIEVQKSGTVVEPTVPADVSVPGVLRHLQKEWDTTMLEMHQVKTQLNETRKELANALYKSEAAERVIARLNQESQEREARAAEHGAVVESREAHANGAKASTAKRGSEGADKVDGKAEANSETGKTESQRKKMKTCDRTKFPSRLLEQAYERSKELQSKRKERMVPKSHASSSSVSSFSETGSVTIDGSNATVRTLARGADGVVYAGTSRGRLCTLDSRGMRLIGKGVNGHDGGRGGVNRVRWDAVSRDRILSCGGDGFLRAWNVEGWGEVGDWGHGSEMVDLDVHPLGGLVMGTMGDGSWIWRELGAGGAVVCEGKGDGKYSSGALHPDGMVFATGRDDGIVEMWDVSSMSCVAKLGEKGGKVGCIEMSEKGYYMACVKDDKVELWDLRKQSVAGVVAVEGIWGVALDGVGEFGCTVGEKGVGFFVGKKKAKTLGQVAVPRGPAGGATDGRVGCVWGEDAMSVLAGGVDGVVRQFGVAEQ